MIDDTELSRLQLFQQVDLASLRDLLAQCHVAQYRARTLLLSPDRPNDRMFILLDGRVSIRLGAQSAEPITWIGPGESVGEMSAHDGLGPSAMVETELDTRMLEIRSDILLALIDRSHAIARNLIYLMAERIRSGNRAMTISLGLQQKLEAHANRDSLTGLYNRRWMDRYFDDLFSVTPEELAFVRLSLLMVDVDHFKRFNDTYGHLAGDEALKAVATALAGALRGSDYVVRFGGEEFTVILPGTAVQHAVGVADKLRHAVSAAEVTSDGQRLPPLTVSIGIAGLQPGDTAASLKRAADQALYAAKEQGRDRACVAPHHGQ